MSRECLNILCYAVQITTLPALLCALKSRRVQTCTVDRWDTKTLCDDWWSLTFNWYFLQVYLFTFKVIFYTLHNFDIKLKISRNFFIFNYCQLLRVSCWIVVLELNQHQQIHSTETFYFLFFSFFLLTPRSLLLLTLIQLPQHISTVHCVRWSAQLLGFLRARNQPTMKWRSEEITYTCTRVCCVCLQKRAEWKEQSKNIILYRRNVQHKC